jgi:hypothetical protein
MSFFRPQLASKDSVFTVNYDCITGMEGIVSRMWQGVQFAASHRG